MKLKNYNIYFNRVLDYAKAVGIDIYFIKKIDNGYFLPKLKKIYIDPSFKEDELLSILLHELGHFEDSMLMNDKKVEKLYTTAAKKIDKNIALSKKEFNCILGCELNAWIHGKIIAKKLKIPTGKWYKKIQDRSIATYYESKTRKGVK